jgi:hypothetical protein
MLSKDGPHPRWLNELLNGYGCYGFKHSFVHAWLRSPFLAEWTLIFKDFSMAEWLWLAP